MSNIKLLTYQPVRKLHFVLDYDLWYNKVPARFRERIFAELKQQGQVTCEPGVTYHTLKHCNPKVCLDCLEETILKERFIGEI